MGGYPAPEGGATPTPPQGAWSPPPQGGWTPPPGGWTPPPPSGWSPTPSPQGPGGGRRRRGPIIAGAIVAAAALVVVGAGLGWAGSTLVGSIDRAPIQEAPQASSGGAGNGSTGATNSGSLASKVDPWVVDVNTDVETSNGSVPAAGSGIILTSGGEVMTNNHVVEGATSISVVVQGRSQAYQAKVIGVDPTDDVALIQLEGASGLPTAKIADSSSVAVGESIADYGNACGRGGIPVATTGTITQLNQSITAEDNNGGAENLTGMMGTSAPIVPGDSGSPLVNSAGQVVGMVTAGNGNGCGGGGANSSGNVPGGSNNQGSGGQSGNSSTVGYAIPTNKAIGIVNQIRAGDASSRIILGQVGFLGVDVEDLTAQSAQQLGLSVTSGALIAGFASNSAASQAGIPQYAVITAVDGHSVTSATSLGTVLHQYKPGQQVSVTWANQSGSHTTQVTLGTGPAV